MKLFLQIILLFFAILAICAGTSDLLFHTSSNLKTVIWLAIFSAILLISGIIAHLVYKYLIKPAAMMIQKLFPVIVGPVIFMLIILVLIIILAIAASSAGH
jgi:hypothetical protein